MSHLISSLFPTTRNKTLFFMMAAGVKNIVFKNGAKMPIVGFGTWQNSDESMDESIDAALEAGYRHIDTAYLYGNEAAIGRALKRWFDSGRLKREDLFIVTKLPVVGYQPDRVEKYLKRSLKALQLKYVDLYLIHQPWGLIETGENMLPMDESGNLLHDTTIDHVALWKAMEAQVDAGRTLNIGLSNFNSRQIKRVFQSARIPPSNLQVELHVYFQQRELVAFCDALDITVCAYAPLASPTMIPAFAPLGGDVDSIPRLSPLTEPVVVKIAEKHGKTSAQVLLRHIVQRGISVIPKSSNPDRIRQNIQIFDFNLDDEDVKQLDALDRGSQCRLFSGNIHKGMDKHPEYSFNEPY
uniref:NADP-dependent oxidoreductase domain-containing protein n=1 Tax=Timema monikensis TaxID=170555 RepID=A0A7R9EFQ0_9NEOP|nr:unnamed protein product [Timema monikensis]